MEVIHFRQIDTKLISDLMSNCLCFLAFFLTEWSNSIIALFIVPVIVRISTYPMGLGPAELVLNGAESWGGRGRIFSPFGERAWGNVAPDSYHYLSYKGVGCYDSKRDVHLLKPFRRFKASCLSLVIVLAQGALGGNTAANH
ncbi:hypothetical protein Csa_002799 [Cucumis sativus]|uniref:Uncharacterized protein n=1 Tax=Cucumis sativus TaxID=3659 RepID=A0A0A0KM53_CUCSA|nr:hypothetical protein Csa_002799 [Cucumis sativus]